MAAKDEKNLYDTLNEDVTGVPPEEEAYSLEEILAADQAARAAVKSAFSRSHA